MTACSEIAIRNTNDHFWHLCRSDDVLGSHGYGDPAARGERVGACFPDYRTGLSIQGHQVRVGLPQENQFLAINHSPIRPRRTFDVKTRALMTRRSRWAWPGKMQGPCQYLEM